LYNEQVEEIKEKGNNGYGIWRRRCQRSEGVDKTVNGRSSFTGLGRLSGAIRDFGGEGRSRGGPGGKPNPPKRLMFTVSAALVYPNLPVQNPVIRSTPI